MKKIIDDIMEEAHADSQRIIAEAEADADAVTEKARKECGAVLKRAQLRRDEKLKALKKRFASSRVSRRRAMLLKAKQEIISEYVNRAFEEITGVEGAQYDEIIMKLLSARMRKGDCVIFFPESFEISNTLQADIDALASERKCVYSISRERKNVKDGFIIAYGKIEENCTFVSLFEEKKSLISETAAKLLLKTEETA